MPGGNPDSGGKRRFVGHVYPGNGKNRIQAGPHGPFGLILIRLRPTEVGQNAIAEILGDVPAVPGHGTGDGILVAPHDIT